MLMHFRWLWKVYRLARWTPPEGLTFRFLVWPSDRRVTVYLFNLGSTRSLCFRDEPHEPARSFLARLDRFAFRFESGGPVAMPTAPITSTSLTNAWLFKQQIH